MGCISSKILTRSSGSLQQKANHGFQRSSLIEEIILSNSKSNGDQFLALLRTSSSSAARRSKDANAEQSPPPAAAAAAKIETINVSELLAGLDEENTAEEEEEEQRDDRKDGGEPSPRCASDGAAGRAKSFRTVEKFDALVTRSGSSEHAKPVALAPERDASVVPPPPPPQSSSPEQEEPTTVAAASNEGAVAKQSSASESEQGEAGGTKRRARARQLGELSAPPAAFDFSKSGSLRDWLLGGGQIFSPGSYVTPKFGNVAAPPESEHGGRLAGERHQHAVFDPELVAQFEQAMEELSVDEERVLQEVLVALEAGEKGGTEQLKMEMLNDQPEVVMED